MEELFDLAIRQYYSIVKSAYIDFIDYVREQQSIEINSISQLYEFLRNCQQTIFYLDKKKYHFHGGGCSVWISDKQIIAWDFGYRSWLCGIEPYKMALTLFNFNCNLEEVFDSERISDLCKAEVKNGNMTEHLGQYYINLLSCETKTYTFPSEYDSLIIEKNDHKYKFNKTTTLDRFIRKSTKVYKHIDKLDYNFVLVFMKDNVEIGRYLYNDIAYPESAVKIMDEILLSAKLPYSH
jgi:hypothetical protein